MGIVLALSCFSRYITGLISCCTILTEPRYLYHANFVTGIEGRDKAGPSQQYSLKEVETMTPTIYLLFVQIFLTTYYPRYSREGVDQPRHSHVRHERADHQPAARKPPQHVRLLHTSCHKP